METISTPEAFISKFHNLVGTTVGNRRQSLFKLLRDYDFLKQSPELLDPLISKLVPQTFLENLFHLEVLIYFRRTTELIEILKQGNEIFVSKIAKQLWFFDEAFGHIEAQQLVNEILPSTSYSVRLKILKRLSQCLSNKDFDKVFDAIIERYGISLALNFLLGCSNEKILYFITNQRIELKGNQLKILYKRDPQLIKTYFKAFDRYKVSYKMHEYQSLFMLILNNDLQFYEKLVKDFGWNIQLGKRTTRRFVYAKRNDIISKPKDYKPCLHMATAIRKLRQDSKILLANCLPKPKNYQEVFILVSDFPTKYRYELLIQILAQHYNLDIISCLNNINEDFVQCLEPVSRQEIARAKIKDGDHRFLRYLNLEESIPYIKEQINLNANMEERRKFLLYLVETCYYNKNLDALKSVLEYFCSRHRNEKLFVYDDLLNTIRRTFGVASLTKEMWPYILEIFELRQLKFNKNPTTEENLGYAEFLFREKKSVDELLLSVLKEQVVLKLSSIQHNLEFWKYVLLFFLNNAPEVFKDKLNSERLLKEFDVSLIGEIEKLNSKYPTNKIDFLNYPRLVKHFKEALISSNRFNAGRLQKILKSLVLKLPEDNIRKEYLELFWNNVAKLGDFEYFIWFLKYDPLQIKINITPFISKNVSNKSILVWYNLKKYSHLHIDQNCIDYCLNDKDNPRAIEILSYLMPSNDYKTLADSHKITEKKLDLKDEEAKKLYGIRCAIAKNYKNTKHFKAIDSLLNYCAGDYLGSALPSLYSFLYHTPENQLGPTLEKMSKKAVSVRKHVLFLTLQLCTVESAEKIITMLYKTEGTQSLQKRLLDSTLKYFIRNSSDRLFELVKLNIRFTNKNDDELLTNLVNITSIPSNYKSQYVEYLWDFLKVIEDKPKQYKLLREKLINRVNLSTVENMSLVFCRKVLNETFFKSNFSQICIRNFVQILFQTDKNLQIFDLIVQMLKQHDKPEEVLEFMSDLSRITFASKSSEFIKIYFDFWNSIINPVKDFPSYVIAQLLKFKCGFLIAGSFDLIEFSKQLMEFLSLVVSLYSSFVVNNFAEIFNSYCSYFTSAEIDKYHILESLLNEGANDINVTMLVLHLMPNNCANVRYKIISNNIIKRLKSFEHPGVQICANIKFKDYDNINDDDHELMEYD